MQKSWNSYPAYYVALRGKHIVRTLMSSQSLDLVLPEIMTIPDFIVMQTNFLYCFTSLCYISVTFSLGVSMNLGSLSCRLADTMQCFLSSVIFQSQGL